MSCWQPELPDTIIFVDEKGLAPWKIIEDVIAIKENLESQGFKVFVSRYQGLGRCSFRTKSGAEFWVHPYTWLIMGFKRSENTIPLQREGED